jgi:hypothetical protein
MNQADAVARPRPSQPTCSSHSFLLQTRDFGVPLGTVAPGTKMRVTKKMIAMGMTLLQSSRSIGGTVSFSVKGSLPKEVGQLGLWATICDTYDMSGFVRENGRLFGGTLPM